MRDKIVGDCTKAFLLRRSNRNRWTQERTSFEVGDLVKVRNIHTKKKINKIDLPSAIIVEVIPGRDKVPRHYKLDYGSSHKQSKRLNFQRFEYRTHHDLYLVRSSKEDKSNHIEFVKGFFP